MRLLELFCGTKSVSKAVGAQFDEVISLDSNPKEKPTILTDILEWDYRIYPRGYFDAVWASPPCTEYSQLNLTNPHKTPNLPLADKIVEKTIEIIEYYNPDKWFIENPQSGILKNRPFMLGIPFVDYDYCRFSDWGYRKRTRFWGTVDGDDILCYGKNKCANMIGANHKRRPGITTEGLCRVSLTLDEKHRIPPELIKHLFGN